MVRFRFPPATIVIVCVLEFLGLLLIPSAIVSPESAAIGLTYQWYVGLTALLTISFIVQLWRMRRAGVWLYLGAYALHNAVALVVGNWLVYVMLIPLVGAALIFPHWRKMH